MRFGAPILAALLSSTVSASKPLEARNSNYCLSNDEAQQAADIFQELIQDYSDQLAHETLTLDFIDYASAVNIIINLVGEGDLELSSPTFSSRQAFIEGQGAQPKIPFEQLGLWHGCDHVSLRWMTSRSAAGQPTEANNLPVVGNAIIETVRAGADDVYSFRIKAIYSEFNAAAWLINLGVFDLAEIHPPPLPSDRGALRHSDV